VGKERLDHHYLLLFAFKVLRKKVKARDHELTASLSSRTKENRNELKRRLAALGELVALAALLFNCVIHRSNNNTDQLLKEKNAVSDSARAGPEKEIDIQQMATIFQALIIEGIFIFYNRYL